VKIRCLRRRTSPSTPSQSTWSQSQILLSGPFTPATAITGLAAASNMSLDSNAVLNAHLHRLTRPASAPFQAKASAPIRPVDPDPGWKRRCSGQGFLLPFSCRHSLLGSSLSRQGGQPSLQSAHRHKGVNPRRTLSGLPRSAHARCDRSGCPLDPGAAVLTRHDRLSPPAPAAFQRPALLGPLPRPICGPRR
jgi:hypothetical protein